VPISPESDYCLCGAVSCLRIAPDIYHGAFLGRLDIDQIIDLDLPFETSIEEAVLQWRETASLEQRVYMAVHGFTDCHLLISEAIDGVINTMAHLDLRARGIIEPIPVFDHPDIVIGDTYQDAIEQLIQHHKIDIWATKLGQQHERIIEALREGVPDTWAECRRIRACYGPDYDGPVPPPMRFDDLPRLQVPRVPASRVTRRERRRIRRVINRGIKAFSDMLGGKDIKAFISGREVLIEGVRYNYLLSNNANIVRHTTHMGHGVPFGLTICDKSGKQLATACIYVPRTPILDQVLILALNVKEPESEVEFLQTANVMYCADNYDLIPESNPLRMEAEETEDQEIVGEPPAMTEFIHRSNRYVNERDMVLRHLAAHRPLVARRIREISQIPEPVFAMMLRNHTIDARLVGQISQVSLAA
jgi:hypothetical protein